MQVKDNYSDYKTELEKKKVISFVPAGDSMWPFIKGKKQSVIIEKNTTKLEKWQVAFYQRLNGQMVLHRIIAVTDKGYIACGDSQIKTEEVSESQVFGMLTGFYKNGKYVSASDEKYLKAVEKWYKSKFRVVRIKLFRAKNKIKKFFTRKGK